ncbi:MAG: ABC transporter permease [Clostridiales bacterium]|nr:ABC transporter permease [Clostridiales bacterium]
MRHIYRSLAANALRKNKIIYVPYIISSLIMVAITYIITAIAKDEYLRMIEGGAMLQQIMIIGIPVMYIISFFFLIGVSRFVIKQRKKELGVYCVLGMQKKHIIHVQFLENLNVFLISTIAGSIIGIVLEKVFQLVFLRIYHHEVDFSWNLPLSTIFTNAMVFAGFFLFFFLINAIGILRSNILEYMKEEAKGEKQPKSKWILAIAGVLLLSGGYLLSFSMDNGLSALQYFGLAVSLVIFGTYALFTAGSITLLNTLKKNKKFYYKTGHFISISGMLYRMKRNAANLATICIFATMVLVTMSSVMTLYSTVHDMASSYYVVDLDILYETPDTDEIRQERLEKIRQAADKSGVSIDQIYIYKYMNAFARIKNGVVLTAPSYLSIDACEIFIFTEDIYNYTNNTTLDLKENEIALYCRSGKDIGDTIAFQAMDKDGYAKDGVSEEFNLRKITEAPKMSSGSSIAVSDGLYYFIVPNDAVLAKLEPYINENVFEVGERNERLLINTSSGRPEQLAMFEEIRTNQPQYDYLYVNSRIDSIEEIVGIYSGLFFLGLFLSIAFLTITILNMYFSQLQQGYEDSRRFAIMRKVGLTRKEIKKSINSQIVVVFLLPLIVAVIHTAAAYPMVNRILRILGGCEPQAFLLILSMCVVVFALFYTIAYLFTRRTYLKMVSGAYDGK